MNIRIMNTRFSVSILTAGLALTLLTACGESDLNDLHSREIDAANRAATAEAEAAASVDQGNSTVSTDETPSVAVDGDTVPQTQGPTQATDNSNPFVEPDNAGNGDQQPAVGSTLNAVDLSSYELVFSDDFDGSQLDSSKWNTAYQWGPDLVINDEKQYYVDTQNKPEFGYDPFQFDGDVLTITADKTPADLLASADDQPYLSGALTTAGKFKLTYGYIEARIRLPRGNGVWPAFWMLSSEYEKLKPQLFIMEHDGGRPNSVFLNYNYHDADDNLRSPGQWEVAVEGLADSFHTVGLEWSPEELLYYIDGVPRYRIIGSNVSNQDMYLIVNLAMGGVWTGDVGETTVLPAEYKIDYIRAYRRR